MDSTLRLFNCISFIGIFWLSHVDIKIIFSPLRVCSALNDGAGTPLWVVVANGHCNVATLDLFLKPKHSRTFFRPLVQLPVLLNGIWPKKLDMSTWAWEQFAGNLGSCFRSLHLLYSGTRARSLFAMDISIPIPEQSPAHYNRGSGDVYPIFPQEFRCNISVQTTPAHSIISQPLQYTKITLGKGIFSLKN